MSARLLRYPPHQHCLTCFPLQIMTTDAGSLPLDRIFIKQRLDLLTARAWLDEDAKLKKKVQPHWMPQLAPSRCPVAVRRAESQHMRKVPLDAPADPEPCFHRCTDSGASAILTSRSSRAAVKCFGSPLAPGYRAELRGGRPVRAHVHGRLPHHDRGAGGPARRSQGPPPCVPGENCRRRHRHSR